MPTGYYLRSEVFKRVVTGKSSISAAEQCSRWVLPAQSEKFLVTEVDGFMFRCITMYPYIVMLWRTEAPVT
ncbi:hypothetical protein ACVK1X_003840 [Pseudomonas sp. PvR086]